MKWWGHIEANTCQPQDTPYITPDLFLVWMPASIIWGWLLERSASSSELPSVNISLEWRPIATLVFHIVCPWEHVHINGYDASTLVLHWTSPKEKAKSLPESKSWRCNWCKTEVPPVLNLLEMPDGRWLVNSTLIQFPSSASTAAQYFLKQTEINDANWPYRWEFRNTQQFQLWLFDNFLN